MPALGRVAKAGTNKKLITGILAGAGLTFLGTRRNDIYNLLRS
jgi:hypothetical protein